MRTTRLGEQTCTPWRTDKHAKAYKSVPQGGVIGTPRRAQVSREPGRYEDRDIKKGVTNVTPLSMSGYQDSNLGPPAPKAGALTGLRYIPSCF